MTREWVRDDGAFTGKRRSRCRSTRQTTVLHGATLWVNSLITVGSLTAVAGCGCTELSAIRSRAAAAEPIAKKKKNTVCKKNKKSTSQSASVSLRPLVRLRFCPPSFNGAPTEQEWLVKKKEKAHPLNLVPPALHHAASNKAPELRFL